MVKYLTWCCLHVLHQCKHMKTQEIEILLGQHKLCRRLLAAFTAHQHNKPLGSQAKRYGNDGYTVQEGFIIVCATQSIDCSTYCCMKGVAEGHDDHIDHSSRQTDYNSFLSNRKQPSLTIAKTLKYNLQYIEEAIIKKQPILL